MLRDNASPGKGKKRTRNGRGKRGLKKGKTKGLKEGVKERLKEGNTNKGITLV